MYNMQYSVKIDYTLLRGKQKYCKLYKWDEFAICRSILEMF